MDAPGQERSSSSQNVKISELLQEGAGGKTLRVTLSNGSFFIIPDDSQAADLAREIYACAEGLREESIQRLKLAQSEYLCRKKALELLARAEQCRRGMEVKLLKKDFPRETVDCVLNSMEESGLLDDARYAQCWLRSRIRGGSYGPARLIADLRSKGISGSTAAEALEEVLEETGHEAMDNAMEKAWHKVTRGKKRTETQIIGALVRRGFSYYRIKEFIAEQNDDEDSGPGVEISGESTEPDFDGYSEQP